MLFNKTDHELRQVIVPVADIRKGADGPRLRQLLYGEPVKITRDHDSHVEVEALRDGYRGHMQRSDLGVARNETHKVTALATHVYSAPDIKSAELMSLSFGAKLSVVETVGAFLELETGGYVPLRHCRPMAHRFADPVGVAEMFFGTPYLWGGNSRLGIDCSGLVQAAALACGMSCPGDSGDQLDRFGELMMPAAELRRGDLLFWKGHVAWVSAPGRILHANAHHMAVVAEPIAQAIDRIRNDGGGEIIGRKRINLFKKD